jgi:hypothetical protein
MKPSRIFALVLGLFVTLALATSAFADGWITAGTALRTKTIGPFTAKVYNITSLTKEAPKERSKVGMINADVDKQLLLYMLRDVDADKMKNAMRDAFKMNGYGDGGKIEQFVAAFGKGDVDEWEKKNPASVSIYYSAKDQTTTMTVPGHGKASVGGADFMKAVWSIWYGKIDQPAMGDQLIANLPKS